MRATNVPFDDGELDSINRAARDAGVSAKQFIRDAALNRALAKEGAFASAALNAYEHTREAFDLQFPPSEERRANRSAEAAAARRLQDDTASGTAA